MIDKEEWTEVETVTSNNEENKVEFEVEEEEKKVEAQVQTEPKVQVEPEPEAEAETEPVKEELDGIETKGAQKRIRQLVKQRKDRDDQITQLIQQNETLNTRLNTREQEFHNISKLNLDANEKQITDKLELARAAYASAHGDGDSEKLVKAQEFLIGALSFVSLGVFGEGGTFAFAQFLFMILIFMVLYSTISLFSEKNVFLISILVTLIGFFSIDVETNKAVKKRFHIHEIPTLLIIQNGQVVQKIEGIISRKDLENKLIRLV